MSSEQAEQYDFFLSRRGAVAAIAREVADVLTEKGYRIKLADGFYRGLRLFVLHGF